MKRRKPGIPAVIMILLYFGSCHSGASSDRGFVPADSAILAGGEMAFNHNCSGCHNFSRDGIGPQLGGLTTKVSAGWILRFIKDPRQVIASGDERARQLFKRYKVMMPSFGSLKGKELTDIVAFLDAHRNVSKRTGKKGLSNPIPEPIALSDLVVNLKWITQIPSSVDSGKHPMARITKLDFSPGTNDLFVVDLRGKLYKLDKRNEPALYLDIARWKPKFINEPGLATGFGSFAFHPDFARNGLFYTTHTEAPHSGKADFSYGDSIKVTLQWVLTEWKAKDPGAAVFSGTNRELLRVDMVSGIHGMQEIGFDPLAKAGTGDYGLLYIAVGDGGCVEGGYPFLAHSRGKIWGTILRIDPGGRNSANGQYGIPQSNPFARRPDGKTLGEIYAYGFRNPHRISWTKSGYMLACNIGQTNIESIDLIRPGNDYGWPVREGSFVLDPYGDLNQVYPLPADDSVYHITYPVAEFDHDEGHAISGGLAYEGRRILQLKGKYLFGDIPSGRLFYIDVADLKKGRPVPIKEWKFTLNGIPQTFEKIAGGGRVDLHFGKDSRGGLYILTKADGRIYKIMSASEKLSNVH